MGRLAVAGLGLAMILGCSTSAPGPSTTSLPVHLENQPRQVLCMVTEAHLTSPSFPSLTTDVVVGSISWPDLKTWASADPSGYRAGGSLVDFKIGAQIKAGATVTVSVAPAARAYAGLDYGQASGYSPAGAVTFHSCASADTAFIGGFHVEGRKCVPFDVTEDHKHTVRIVISFFNGRCDAL